MYFFLNASLCYYITSNSSLEKYMAIVANIPHNGCASVYVLLHAISAIMVAKRHIYDSSIQALKLEVLSLERLPP